jgi:GH18 family chitinase
MASMLTGRCAVCYMLFALKHTARLHQVPLNAAEATQYVQLFLQLRQMFGSTKLISCAVTSVPNADDGWGWFDFEAMTPVVDFYNVMSYDYYSDSNFHCGHNSPLTASPHDPEHVGSITNTTE